MYEDETRLTCLLVIILLALQALCANLFCIRLLSLLSSPSAAVALLAFSNEVPV